MAADSIERLVHSAQLLQTVKYANVASFALLIYDYFQTLELEVDLIWKAKWGLERYSFCWRGTPRLRTFLWSYTLALPTEFVILDVTASGISDPACHKIYSVASWATAFGIGWAEAILVLRTFALSGNSRRLLACLVTLYAAIYISVMVVLAKFLESLRYGAPPLPTVKGCYPTDGSLILFADFVLLMVFETVIMVITLVIGIRRFRHTHSRLVTTLYTDGIFYFIYLALISLGNIIVLVAGPPEFVDLLNTFQRVMHSVLSCRILLHVRKAGSYQSFAGDSSNLSRLDHSTEVVSDLRFRQ